MIFSSGALHSPQVLMPMLLEVMVFWDATCSTQDACHKLGHHQDDGLDF